MPVHRRSLGSRFCARGRPEKTGCVGPVESAGGTVRRRVSANWDCDDRIFRTYVAHPLWGARTGSTLTFFNVRSGASKERALIWLLLRKLDGDMYAIAREATCESQVARRTKNGALLLIQQWMLVFEDITFVSWNDARPFLIFK